jgi:hypothetical protein
MRFKASSGNVCILTLAGKCGNRVAVDASWDVSPSKADIKECDAFWASVFPQHMQLSMMANTEEEVKSMTDGFLNRRDN